MEIPLKSLYVPKSEVKLNIIELHVTPKRQNKVQPNQNGCQRVPGWTKLYRDDDSSMDYQENETKNLNLSCDHYEDTSPCLENGIFHDDAAIVRKKDVFRKKLVTWKFPYFILVASVIQVAVFMLANNSTYEILKYDPYRKQEVWRFISYILLHNGTIHLALNVFIQCFVTVPLEGEQGWFRCLLIYLSGALGGSLGESLCQSNLFIVGSSGGVYALLLSHIPNVLLNSSQITFKRFRYFAVFVLAMSDASYNVYHILNKTLPKIGIAAHCFGAATGALVGMVLYKGSDRKKLYLVIATWSSTAILIIFIITAILSNLYLIETPERRIP